MQELKQLLAMACHKDSRLLVIGVANSITLVEEYAQELNLTVSQHLFACRWTCASNTQTNQHTHVADMLFM